MLLHCRELQDFGPWVQKLTWNMRKRGQKKKQLLQRHSRVEAGLARTRVELRQCNKARKGDTPPTLGRKSKAIFSTTVQSAHAERCVSTVDRTLLEPTVSSGATVIPLFWRKPARELISGGTFFCLGC